MKNAPLIPAEVKGQLDRYQNHGLRPGGFVHAILINDLLKAARLAPVECLVAFGTICRYVADYMPMASRGSVERYETWLDSFAEMVVV